MQAQAITDELGGVGVPMLMKIPGTGRTVLTTRLLTFTGHRFVNTSALRASLLSDAAPSAGSKRPRPAEAAAQPGPLVDVPRPAIDGAPGAAEAPAAPAPVPANVVAGAEAAADSTLAPRVDAPSAQAIGALLDVIEGRAPARLSAPEVLALVDAAVFYAASELLQHLPNYLAPLLCTAPYLQVRDYLLHSFLLHTFLHIPPTAHLHNSEQRQRR